MSTRSDDLAGAKNALQEAREASNADRKVEKVIEALERLIKLHEEQDHRKETEFGLGG